MDWLLAVVALLLVGYVCRRVLQLDEHLRRPCGLAPLPPHVDDIFRPISQEVETRTVILRIILNDALGARHSGDDQNAFLHVGLALSHWDRLSEFIGALLNSILHNLPQAGSVGPVRELASSQFKSRAMMDFMNGDARLHQMIFRSRTRYNFRVQVIQRAVRSLTKEFRSTSLAGERAPHLAAAMWNEIDPISHDYDVMVKEALLALRVFLPTLQEAALREFSSEVTRALGQSSVRSKRAAAPHLTLE